MHPAPGYVKQFPARDTIIVDSFAPTASQTVFTLSREYRPGGLAELKVNGIGYLKGTDYTLAAKTLTWLDVDFTLDTSDVLSIAYEVF